MDDCKMAHDDSTCILFHHNEDYKRIQRELFNDYNKDKITTELKERNM
jgi:hypothetical protein